MPEEVTIKVAADSGDTTEEEINVPDDGAGEDETEAWASLVRAEVSNGLMPVMSTLQEIRSMMEQSTLQDAGERRTMLETLQALTSQIAAMGAVALQTASQTPTPGDSTPTPGDSTPTPPSDGSQTDSPASGEQGGPLAEAIEVEVEAPAPAPRRIRPVL